MFDTDNEKQRAMLRRHRVVANEQDVHLLYFFVDGPGHMRQTIIAWDIELSVEEDGVTDSIEVYPITTEGLEDSSRVCLCERVGGQENYVFPMDRIFHTVEEADAYARQRDKDEQERVEKRAARLAAQNAALKS